MYYFMHWAIGASHRTSTILSTPPPLPSLPLNSSVVTALYQRTSVHMYTMAIHTVVYASGMTSCLRSRHWWEAMWRGIRTTATGSARRQCSTSPCILPSTTRYVDVDPNHFAIMFIFVNHSVLTSLEGIIVTVSYCRLLRMGPLHTSLARIGLMSCGKSLTY
jgi:hypothetical protein